MKAFKLFLLTLFAALGLSAHAQTIEVYKDGQVIDSFSAAQVDSVVYKYAEPQARYYYYAGWECPTNETELANLAKAPNGGYIGTTLGTYSATNVLYDYTDNNVAGTSKSQFYVIIPQGIQIYDADKALSMDPFTLEGTIGRHNVYKSVRPFANIDTIILF